MNGESSVGRLGSELISETVQTHTAAVGTLTRSRQQGCLLAVVTSLDSSCMTWVSQWSVNLRHHVRSIVLASVGHGLGTPASKGVQGVLECGVAAGLLIESCRAIEFPQWCLKTLLFTEKGALEETLYHPEFLISSADNITTPKKLPHLRMVVK